MKMCIFGAGAIGGHLGAKLAHAGHDVSVVARGAHLDAIRLNGLTLVEGDRTIVAKVRASADPAALGVQDVVFVTLKSTANRAFAEAAGPLLGPDTIVVFVQNGIPWWYAYSLGSDCLPPPDLGVLDAGGVLHRLIGPERVIGAVIYTSNEVTQPGVITNDSVGANSLILGEPDDRQSPRVVKLRAALEAAAIGSPDCADIRATLWRRLIVNMAGSVLSMVVEEPVGWVQGDAALSSVYGLVARDGAAIAAAHGVDIEAGTMPAYGTPRFPPAHKPSILQDYERARPLEIDGLLTVPLAFATAAGIDTPALSVLAAIATSRALSRRLYQRPTVAP